MAARLARVGVQLGRLGRPGERLHDYEELTELAAKREAEEEARLAYVAATRAKRRLLLSGTFNPRRSSKKEPIGRKPITAPAGPLHARRGPAEATWRCLAAGGRGTPAGRLRVGVSAPGPERRRRAADAARGGREPAERWRPPAEPPLLRPAAPPALTGGLSYSALSEFANCGYRFYVERVLGIGRSPRTRDRSEDEEPGRPRGAPPLRARARRPHAARVDRPQPLARPRPGASREALCEQGLDDRRASRALELAGALLSSPLREEIGGDRCGAEVPFVLSVAGTLVRGSIDLLVERADGSVLVVDYKTDRLDGRDPEEAPAATRSSETSTRSPQPLAARRSRPPTSSSSAPDPPVRERLRRGRPGRPLAQVGERAGEAGRGALRGDQPPASGPLPRLPGARAALQPRPGVTLRDDPDPRRTRPRGSTRAEGEASAELLEGG